ncbi:hypothetical protein D3C73_1433180 [compost metagenome]
MPSFDGKSSKKAEASTTAGSRGFSGEAKNEQKRSHSSAAKTSSPFSEAIPNSSFFDEGIRDVIGSDEESNALHAKGNMALTNKQQLAQGVVWAEILGPPRSKKPLRRH